MADTAHLSARIPDGPAGAARHRQAHLAGQHLHIAAQILVKALVDGDEGAARTYLHTLRHDPAQPVDPWALAEAATALALHRGTGTASPSQR